MIQIAVVEDELAAAKTLMNYLNRYEKERGIPLKVSHFENSLMFLGDTTSVYDIVFMDIEMPYMNGMEAAAELRTRNSETCLIFVTNLAQYAVKGYEVDAMDFIVKPVSYEPLAFKMDKAVSVAHKRRTSSITLRLKSGIVRLAINDIRYIESLQHRIIYHTGSEDIETWDSLSRIETTLDPYPFSRCSASHLVNLHYVDRVDGDTVYVGNDALPLTRGKKKQFMKDFLEYLGG